MRNTPIWVQHIAFQMKDRDALIGYIEHLKDNGEEVPGITHPTIFNSVYFLDPNGHRGKLAAAVSEQVKKSDTT